MTSIPHLDDLLNSEDINGSIIELDNFIGELCDYGDDFGQLSDAQRSFYYNQNLEREVNNGGFNQYFFNSSGDNAAETVLSLQEIGANKTAMILQRAIDQFPDKRPPKDRDERTQILEEIEQAANQIWEGLDQEFFKNQDDLNVLNMEYVKQHRKYF